MITNVTSLTGNGLKDWLIQRITATYFAFYVLFIFIFLLAHPQLQYSQWQALFQAPWFKGASLLAFLAFILHTWIGIWTVLTDYVKCTVIRLSLQMLVALFLMGQFVWALMIVWGQ